MAWPLSPLQAGRELLHSHPSAQEDIQDRLQGLNHKWEELHSRMAEQGDKLQQTRQQEQLVELLQVPGECGMGRGHRRKTRTWLGQNGIRQNSVAPQSPAQSSGTE